MTTAQTATEAALMATARSIETRTVPTMRTSPAPPATTVTRPVGVRRTAGT